MYIRKVAIAITTAADGSATAYSEDVTGEIVAVIVGAGLAASYGVTITVEDTTEAIVAKSSLTGAQKFYPRAAVHDVVGVAATFDGTRPIVERVCVCESRIKVVVAAGGNVASATVYVLLA